MLRTAAALGFTCERQFIFCAVIKQFCFGDYFFAASISIAWLSMRECCERFWPFHKE